MNKKLKPTYDESGRMLFFHFSPVKITSTISPSFHGKNVYTSDVRSRGVSYYYTRYGEIERMISGDLYVVSLNPNEVYYFNEDSNDYYTAAKKEFFKDNPKGSFGPTQQMEYITDFAVKDGYKMIVASWENSFRAESPLPLKFDKKLTVNYRAHGVSEPTTDMEVEKIRTKSMNIINAVANSKFGIPSGITDLVYSIKNPNGDIGFKKLLDDNRIIKILGKKLSKEELNALKTYYNNGKD